MLEKNLSNDKNLEVIVAISRKKNSCTIFDKKITEKGMNKNPENWQCVVPFVIYKQNSMLINYSKLVRNRQKLTVSLILIKNQTSKKVLLVFFYLLCSSNFFRGCISFYQAFTSVKGGVISEVILNLVQFSNFMKSLLSTFHFLKTATLAICFHVCLFIRESSQITYAVRGG